MLLLELRIRRNRAKEDIVVRSGTSPQKKAVGPATGREA